MPQKFGFLKGKNHWKIIKMIEKNLFHSLLCYQLDLPYSSYLYFDVALQNINFYNFVEIP